MRENVFRFKQFSVINQYSAMKVGTDGVLLGAWCDISNVTNILDIGTGCGLIALMLAQRTIDVNIDAVEIDYPAFIEASENFANSPWQNRLNLQNADFNQFSSISTKKYDLIVSNPPYFNNSLHSVNGSRTTARHSKSLTIQDIVVGSKRILSKNGKISLITPSNLYEMICDIVDDNGMYLEKLTFIRPTLQGDIKRIMWQISIEFNNELVEDELIIEWSRHK